VRVVDGLAGVEDGGEGIEGGTPFRKDLPIWAAIR
jgi:hypothetical protein